MTMHQQREHCSVGWWLGRWWSGQHVVFRGTNWTGWSWPVVGSRLRCHQTMMSVSSSVQRDFLNKVAAIINKLKPTYWLAITWHVWTNFDDLSQTHCWESM